MTEFVWYIHGANASPATFACIKDNLPVHRYRDISYSVETPLSDTIARLREEIRLEKEPVTIVGHSLGGVIAVAIAEANVKRIVTMGTPFGGSKLANVLRWWFPSQLFEDIRTSSPIIMGLQRTPITVPILSFVTTGGSIDMLREPNDGVVTLESQLHLDGPTYIELPLNHYEVLLSPSTIKPMRDFIFD